MESKNLKCISMQMYAALIKHFHFVRISDEIPPESKVSNAYFNLLNAIMNRTNRATKDSRKIILILTKNPFKLSIEIEPKKIHVI